MPLAPSAAPRRRIGRDKGPVIAGNAGIEGYRSALDAAGKDYTIHIYEDVNHAFHNDTSEARYDRATAELAWNRTLDFLRETLG